MAYELRDRRYTPPGHGDCASCPFIQHCHEVEHTGVTLPCEWPDSYVGIPAEQTTDVKLAQLHAPLREVEGWWVGIMELEI